jgi:orotidine-5'-phosphate decarboxylase
MALTPLPIFLALDDPDWDLGHVRRMASQIVGVKLGMAFFYRLGPAGVAALQEVNVPLFLDVKVHDIPNTAAAAVRALTALGASYMTLHAAGGGDMLRAARQAADEEADSLALPRPKLLGVTVLTSMDQTALSTVGVHGPLIHQVRRLADISVDAGLDGIVCSAMDLGALSLPEDFLAVTPGIRLPGMPLDDQVRTMTPGEALTAGATHLVMGRPLLRATDPLKVLSEIRQDMGL